MSDRTGRTSVDVAVPVRECLQFASTLPQNNRRTGQCLCPDAGIGRCGFRESLRNSQLLCVAGENVVDESLLSCGVGLAIVAVVFGQLDFQFGVGANQARVCT